MIRNRYIERALVALAICMLASCASTQPKSAVPSDVNFDHQYSAWRKVLGRCARPDGFDYSVILQEQSIRDDLNRQVERIEAVKKAEFEAFSKPQRLAFLINGHNLFAVRRVVENYPVRSIHETAFLGRDQSQRDIPLIGRRWSLKSLRMHILRTSGDCRTVFLLNWGMRSCVPLASQPCTAENINLMLEARPRWFLDQTAFNRFDLHERTLYVSPLISRYNNEIERDFTTVWAFIRHYSSKLEINNFDVYQPGVDYLDWDSRLNDKGSTPDPTAG